jgi:alpha-tubulin suppressor-like RCC1 family protein
VSPSLSIIGVNQTVAFQAVGGEAPYTYSMQSGFGSIDSASGLYTAPASPGTSTIKVVDAQNNSTYAVVTVSSGLILSPANITVGSSSTFQFSAGGGVAPFSFSLQSGTGSVHPSTGLYTAPASTGSTVIKVTDSQGSSATSNITITNQLTLTPDNQILEDGTTITMMVAGGTPPYTFSKYTGVGLIHSSTGIFNAGVIAGTSVLRVTDANGMIDEATLTVSKGPEINLARTKVAIGRTLQFIVSEGTPPYTYSTLSGAGTINTSGLFTASPGPGQTVVKVTDANGFFQNATIETFSPTKIGIGISQMCMVRTLSDGVTSETKCVGRTIYGETPTNKQSYGDQTGEMGDQLPALSLGTNLSVLRIYSSHNNRICALFSNYSLKCWGENGSGGTGASTTAVNGYNQPSMGVKVPYVGLGTGVIVDNTVNLRFAVDLGSTHSCGIVSGKDLKCWGSNGNGQLGLGDTNNRCTAVSNCGNNLGIVPLGGEDVIQVTAGSNFTCVLLSPSERVKCWGINDSGQLGLGDTTSRGHTAGTTPDLLPYVDLGTLAGNPIKVKEISAGWQHVCALLEDNTIKCWGNNSTASLGKPGLSHLGDGAGEMGNSLTAVSLSSTKTPKKIFSQVYANCVVFTDDSMKCWGHNSHGQLGLGDINHRGDTVGEMGDSLPFVDMGGEGVKEAYPGYTHSCALTHSNKIKCWGRNIFGDLGLGDMVDRGDGSGEMGTNLPFVNLSSTATVLNADVTNSANCAALSDGKVKCWGYDEQTGVLGLEVGNVGAVEAERVPLLPSISFGSGVYAKDVRISYLATCFVMNDNSYRCYGYNSYGDLALGDSNQKGLLANSLGANSPTPQFGTGLNIVDAVFGAHVGCFLTDDGKIKCWGYGIDGRNGLGHGNTIGDHPSEVGNNLAFLSLGADVAKSIHSKGPRFCAVFTNNQAKCWGYNGYGELGYDDTANRGHTIGTVPSALPYINLGLGRSIKQLETGGGHSCAILDNDKIKCWGKNDMGQLGYEDTIQRGDNAGEMAALGYVDLGAGLVPKKLALGSDHSCVLFTNEKIKCWGAVTANGNADWLHRGTLLGSMGDALPFVNYGSSFKVLDIYAGGSGTCVVLEDNSVKCWGGNSYGQLGLGHRFDYIGADPLSMGVNLPSF